MNVPSVRQRVLPSFAPFGSTADTTDGGVSALALESGAAVDVIGASVAPLEAADSSSTRVPDTLFLALAVDTATVLSATAFNFVRESCLARLVVTRKGDLPGSV